MLDRRELLRRAGLWTPMFLGAGGVWARAEEPAAEDRMLVHSRVPHNSEPPLARLVESWITPNEWFYVRSHAPVPEIDDQQFRLSVEGLVDRDLRLSLGELRDRFRRHTAAATLTCAGNRRSEHSLTKPVAGVPWQAGAIGNARWSGVRLSDVLRMAGIKEGAKHVWFEGLDKVPRDDGTIPFGASIPIDKALADSDSVPGALLADQMNGQPLPPDHGFPLRTVVPGFIGARSVKWLGKIVVSDRPSPNHYVSRAYKLVVEDADEQWDRSPPIDHFVINSVVCVPRAGARVAPGRLTVKGYALADGRPDGRIERVEVSADGGRNWTNATFTRESAPFCWRLWSVEVPVARAGDKLIVRAADSSGNMQPRRTPWNLKGYLFNGWHETGIEVG